MNLVEYLKKHRTSIRDLARAANVHGQYLSDVVRGKFPCGPQVAAKVQAATNNEVLANDMISGAACVKLKPGEHLSWKPHQRDVEAAERRRIKGEQKANERRTNKKFDENVFDL